MPPLPVTGVNDGARSFCNNTVVGTASVVVNDTASIFKRNVLLLVCATASVTVTVYVVAIVAMLGVPEICPLAVLNINPAGNVGLIANTNAGTPPVAVTGINAVAAAFCDNDLVAIT